MLEVGWGAVFYFEAEKLYERWLTCLMVCVVFFSRKSEIEIRETGVGCSV